MADHLLNENQNKILDDLESIINEMHENYKEGDGKAYKLGFNNAVGIFGSRGAGKSTLLFELFKRNAENSSVYYLQPIDCSILAATTIPSSVVLLNIKNFLQNKYKNDKHDKAIEKMCNKLDNLIGCCARTDKVYRKLCLELSTSPGDYDHYQEKGIQERLQLKQDIQDWIIELRGLIDNKSFVFLLDDFDLTSVTQVQAWIRGLMDELQQIGLIFVLTADFYRLEHLSWDSKEQFDDKTGRALINKIFPPKNCFLISEWPIKDSREFCFPKCKNLETLLNDLLNNNPELSKELVFSLLPRLPRGIENLYELLLINTNSADKEDYDALGFASILATCRNEPLLARLLKERSNRTWQIYLPLSNKRLSIEQWKTLIDSATERSRPLTDTLKPLRNLLQKPKPVKANNKVDESAKVLLSDEHAPLVHVNDYTAPLRDANHADANLWVELLLDLDFYQSSSPQAYFFTTWKPLVDKVNKTQFTLTFPSWDLQAFFMDNEYKLQKSTLCWLSNPKDHTVNIGWQPLFNTARGEEDPLSLGLLTKFLVNTHKLRGTLPTEKQFELLPERLWSMLIFADALDRCPWQTFSHFLNWLLVTYIALAAALVRTAYLYSLVKCDYIYRPISAVQQEFINMLENRDPSFLMDLTEKQIWEKLTELFNDNDWETRLDEQHNLQRVTRNYLKSPMYRDVVSLLQHTVEFYN